MPAKTSKYWCEDTHDVWVRKKLEKRAAAQAAKEQQAEKEAAEAKALAEKKVAEAKEKLAREAAEKEAVKAEERARKQRLEALAIIKLAREVPGKPTKGNSKPKKIGKWYDPLPVQLSARSKAPKETQEARTVEDESKAAESVKAEGNHKPTDTDLKVEPKPTKTGKWHDPLALQFPQRVETSTEAREVKKTEDEWKEVESVKLVKSQKPAGTDLKVEPKPKRTGRWYDPLPLQFSKSVKASKEIQEVKEAEAESKVHESVELEHGEKEKRPAEDAKAIVRVQDETEKRSTEDVKVVEQVQSKSENQPSADVNQIQDEEKSYTEAEARLLSKLKKSEPAPKKKDSKKKSSSGSSSNLDYSGPVVPTTTAYTTTVSKDGVDFQQGGAKSPGHFRWDQLISRFQQNILDIEKERLVDMAKVPVVLRQSVLGTCINENAEMSTRKYVALIRFALIEKDPGGFANPPSDPVSLVKTLPARQSVSRQLASCGMYRENEEDFQGQMLRIDEDYTDKSVVDAIEKHTSNHLECEAAKAAWYWRWYSPPDHGRLAIKVDTTMKGYIDASKPGIIKNRLDHPDLDWEGRIEHLHQLFNLHLVERMGRWMEEQLVASLQEPYEVDMTTEGFKSGADPAHGVTEGYQNWPLDEQISWVRVPGTLINYGPTDWDKIPTMRDRDSEWRQPECNWVTQDFIQRVYDTAMKESRLEAQKEREWAHALAVETKRQKEIYEYRMQRCVSKNYYAPDNWQMPATAMDKFLRLRRAQEPSSKYIEEDPFAEMKAWIVDTNASPLILAAVTPEPDISENPQKLPCHRKTVQISTEPVVVGRPHSSEEIVQDNTEPSPTIDESENLTGHDIKHQAHKKRDRHNLKEKVATKAGSPKGSPHSTSSVTSSELCRKLTHMCAAVGSLKKVVGMVQSGEANFTTSIVRDFAECLDLMGPILKAAETELHSRSSGSPRASSSKSGKLPGGSGNHPDQTSTPTLSPKSPIDAIDYPYQISTPTPSSKNARDVADYPDQLATPTPSPKTPTDAAKSPNQRRTRRGTQTKPEPSTLEMFQSKTVLYMRPAEESDCDQIANIYNLHIGIDSSVQCIDKNNTDVAYWVRMIQRCREEGKIMIVASTMKKAPKKGDGRFVDRSRVDANGHVQHDNWEERQARKNLDPWMQRADKIEKMKEDLPHDLPKFRPDQLAGFAYVDSYAGRPSTILNKTLRLHLYVNPRWSRKGAASALLDRIITILDRTYTPRSTAKFIMPAYDQLYGRGSGPPCRNLVLDLYWRMKDSHEMKWKVDFLKKWNFEQVGHMFYAGAHDTLQ